MTIYYYHIIYLVFSLHIWCVCVCIGIVLDQRRWTGVEWDYKIDYNKYVKDVRTFIQAANEYLKVNNKTHIVHVNNV